MYYEWGDPVMVSAVVLPPLTITATILGKTQSSLSHGLLEVSLTGVLLSRMPSIQEDGQGLLQTLSAYCFYKAHLKVLERIDLK